MRTRLVPTVLRRDAWRRGQSLVEFALVLPIFMLIVCGIFDGSRAVYMNSVLSQAAREAARVASVEAAWIGSHDPACGTIGGPICPGSFEALKADAVAAANRMVTPFTNIPASQVYLNCDAWANMPSGNWTSSSCANSTTGNIASVRVTLSFGAVTPIIGAIIPPVLLSGSASMTID